LRQGKWQVVVSPDVKEGEYGSTGFKICPHRSRRERDILHTAFRAMAFIPSDEGEVDIGAISWEDRALAFPNDLFSFSRSRS